MCECTVRRGQEVGALPLCAQGHSLVGRYSAGLTYLKAGFGSAGGSAAAAGAW